MASFCKTWHLGHGCIEMDSQHPSKFLKKLKYIDDDKKQILIEKSKKLLENKINKILLKKNIFLFFIN